PFDPSGAATAAVIVLLLAAINAADLGCDAAKGDRVPFQCLWFEIGFLAQLGQELADRCLGSGGTLGPEVFKGRLPAVGHDGQIIATPRAGPSRLIGRLQ